MVPTYIILYVYKVYHDDLINAKTFVEFNIINYLFFNYINDVCTKNKNLLTFNMGTQWLN